jgi:hypothetical protein
MSKSSTVFLYNKSNVYGLSQDIHVLETALQQLVGKVRVADPLEPPTPCELAVHFEVPYYGWMSWARRNVIIVNPEWWEAAWNPYLSRVDALIFKCSTDRDHFLDQLPKDSKKPDTYVLPWTTSVSVASFAKHPKSNNSSTGILWLLGASKNKRAAAEKLLPLWKPDWPKLYVSTTTPLTFELTKTQENITINIRDLDGATIRQLQAYYPGHMIFSASEALGMAALEGQAAGAFLLGNGLPTYLETFKGNPYVALTQAILDDLKAGKQDTFASLEDELDDCVEKFLKADLDECRSSQTRLAAMRSADFTKKSYQCFQEIMKKYSPLPLAAVGAFPPQFKSAADCPPISVITLLHNRRKFVDLAFHNLLITDYPKDKIEWVVIEDSDLMEEQAADKIIKFGTQCAPMTVTYIPLDKKNVPIGAMRNRAVKKAQHDIILFMDDDDHYPASSFSRRVAWLLLHPWKPSAVVCTTIACYDLVHGTSAVNTPPWSLPLSQRISEATFAFKKSWWDGQRFPKVNMAEGEGFLQGREADVLELQPQQLIVAMSHGKNASSRRIPPTGKPSCFWGFPKEFLVFLHKLAGVDIEEISS